MAFSWQPTQNPKSLNPNNSVNTVTTTKEGPTSKPVAVVRESTLRVQVLNNRIRTQDLNYSYNYPKLKYLIIEYV